MPDQRLQRTRKAYEEYPGIRPVDPRLWAISRDGNRLEPPCADCGKGFLCAKHAKAKA